MVSLLSDSEGDANSPPQQAVAVSGEQQAWVYALPTQSRQCGEIHSCAYCLLLCVAGIKRKRSEPAQREEKEPDSKQAAFDNPLPQTSPKSTSFMQQSAVPQAAKVLVPADEDDDLCVELNFAKKAKPCVTKASMASEVAAYPSSGTDAALGSFAARSTSGLAWPPSSQQSLQDQAAAAEDDEVYDVPDGYAPQAQGAAK